LNTKSIEERADFAISGFAILDSVPDPIVLLDEHGRIELVNAAFTETFGHDRVHGEGSGLDEIFDTIRDVDVLRGAAMTAREQGSFETEVLLPTASERKCPYQLRYERDRREGERGFVVHFRDVGEEKQLREKLIRLEYLDRRTGLPNRRSLDIILEKEISRVERAKSDELLAVLFISLENIARINQTYGQEVGDILLENSGIRIRESIIAELLRDSDYVFAEGEPGEDEIGEPERVDEDHLVFRFEGKEFTALLTGIRHETDAAVVATRIARSVSMPYRDKYGSEIFINCNIGIAIYPNDGGNREILIHHATSAMHEAKRLGEEFLLFNQALHHRALEAMRLGGSIYNAFIESQFEMYFQPIVDYMGDILGAEALIRWNHPDRGIVGPGQFIPLAEEKGIIVNIGKWAMYNITSKLATWPDDIYISMNVSPVEMAHADILDNVRRALERNGDIDPRRFKIEITERDAMKNPEETIRRMQVLTDRGVEILIDDFGIGNSSLSYLKHLPAKTLKIDRSFVEHIEESQEECAFLESIIELALSRNKSVVVEGIETAGQAALIRQMKPVKFQGYYFSRPVPADEFERLVRSRTRLPVS
jgi:diguanylate cyclase